MNSLGNERGSASFIALAVLLILTLSFTAIMRNDLSQIKQQNRLYRGLLCAKELNGRTSQLIRRMNTTNRMLMLLKAGKAISVLIPKLRLLTGFLGKATKKSLMSYQLFQLNNYRFQLARMNRRSCHALPSAYKTPFKAGAVRIKRDKWDRARSRGKDWKVDTIGGNLKIKSKFELRNGKSKTELRRIF